MTASRIVAPGGRVWAYGVSLLIAWLGYLVFSAGSGRAFLLCGGVSALMLIYGLLRKMENGLYAGACLAVFLVAVALGRAVSQEAKSLAGAVSAGLIGPDLLVTFLASRLLASLEARRFAAFYARPLESKVGRFLALPGAAALALFLLIAFYALAAPSLGGARNAPAGVILAALAGASWIHASLILLFFLSLALIVEASLRHWRDRFALDRLRMSLSNDPVRAAERLSEEVARFGPSRAAHLIGRELGIECLPHYEGFFDASRRFARSVPALLPLLGFFGTVIGLSITMFELEKGMGGGLSAGRVAGALSGLGLKFETTLLGLFGSFIALALLDVLEHGEAECAAACRVVANACKTRLASVSS
ncbi:MAG: MotA/TolQ/ExbB proton channel family protein [Methylocystis sp.]|uniref:MotA/TolQ/ExbB proton channel family protein n=1 Tax=Methylocystis sp. TaxID=1911079 RepID=UPI003DA65EEA